MGSSWSGLLKILWGAIALLGFVGFLLVEVNITSGIGTKPTMEKSSMENLKHFGVIGRNTPVIHSNLDPNIMSKRRVPNGPDPIHNRRAGKSRQPPGRE